MNKYRFITTLFIVINLISHHALGSTGATQLNPYLLIAGNAGTILQECGREQGLNVRNDCFDMKSLFVTKAERDRKFSGHDDFKFDHPSRDPYRTLIESLRIHDITVLLEFVQGLEDEDKFMIMEKYKKSGVPLKEYKKDLYVRFCAIKKRLMDLSSCGMIEVMRTAMADCISLLKEITDFGQDGCKVYGLEFARCF
jgi:hypothetical protein